MANKITPLSTTTPFSGETISQVNANNWDQLTRTQLEDERYKLQQRLSLSYQLNNAAITRALEGGIQRIEYIIENYKASGDNK